MTIRPETLILLEAEMARARKKHPGSSHLMVALTEEVGEVAKAMLDSHAGIRFSTHRDIKAEALQVAVVALRIYEEGDPTVLDETTQAEFPGALR